MITVKELINIVLDSPFYLSMPLQDRKNYIQSFVALYMSGGENGKRDRLPKQNKADLSVVASYWGGTP
jgi:hypothetical protein